jgi:thiosulfate dehydrogenase
MRILASIMVLFATLSNLMLYAQNEHKAQLVQQLSAKELGLMPFVKKNKKAQIQSIIAKKLGYFASKHNPQAHQISAKQIGLHFLDRKYKVLQVDGTEVGFDLVDPGMAPADILPEVMNGYRIVIDTQHYASKYATAKINCTNCHFNGGNTLGGRNGSISLVGVPSVYPRYSPRDKRVLSLEDRINNCFMKSLNGKPLPKDSEEMKNIVAYLDWISKDVAHFKNIPWLGLQIVKSSHQPNPKEGAVIYTNRCAACHRPDGGGAIGIPPLWGKRSFNSSAGMNNLSMATAFIYWNMPYQEPILTIEEAMDVAAFITSQPRPARIEVKDTKEEKKEEKHEKDSTDDGKSKNKTLVQSR